MPVAPNMTVKRPFLSAFAQEEVFGSLPNGMSASNGTGMVGVGMLWLNQ